MCKRHKKEQDDKVRMLPTTYKNAKNRNSDGSSISDKDIEEPRGDTFGIYMIPRGKRGDSDTFRWKNTKEGLAPEEEKTMIIEQLQNY